MPLELIVRDVASGQILLQILIPHGDASRITSDMLQVNAARTHLPATEGEPPQPIAGSLRIEPNAMQKAVAAYVEDLGKRGKTAGTRTQFKTFCLRYARETGTTHPNAITYEAVSAWAAGQAKWSPSTRARALKIISLFTQFCLLARIIDRDPLVGARGHVSVEATGSRAATTEEARALIAQAAARVLTDNRAAARCNRAVYYGCLFLAGCRFDEPRRWRWRDIRLDAEIPHILWRKGRDEGERMHKNNRTRAIALAPELVRALKLWREQLTEINSKAGKLAPISPESLVFPSRPINITLSADRAAAGIPKLDYRDRAFTAHSARKWLATTLPACGAHEKMTDFVMRHTGRTEFRYYDPPLAEQAAALSQLPALFPDFFWTANVRDAKLLRAANRKNEKTTLAKSGEIAEDISVTQRQSTSEPSHKTRLPENAGPDEPDVHCVTTLQSKVPGPAFSGSTLADALRQLPGPRSSFPPSNSGFTIEPPCDETDDIANLLEALARVIRGRQKKDGSKSAQQPNGGAG